MAGVPILSDAQLEQVSRLLGDCATGTDITRVLNSLGLDDCVKTGSGGKA